VSILCVSIPLLYRQGELSSCSSSRSKTIDPSNITDYRPELLHYVRPADRDVAALREDLRQALRWKAQLEAEVHRLKAANARLERDSSPRRSGHESSAAPLTWDHVDRAIKRLLSLVHPDKWADSPIALELTKHLNAWREALKEGRV
jgi:hypothetical protein